MQPAAPARQALVKISYGVHHLEVPIAGKSVGEVRQALREPLNIDPRALALVNGRETAASYVLKENDQLEFVRLAGEKGMLRETCTKDKKSVKLSKRVLQRVYLIINKAAIYGQGYY